MTIALAIASNDGVVLATDSASTSKNTKKGTNQVFHQKQKLFQMHDKLPIGLVTFGLNRIGAESVTTLLRELRQMLSGKLMNGDDDWSLGDDWKLTEIGDRLKELIFDKHYLPIAPKLPPKDRRMGFFIAGYSAGKRFPEIIEMAFDGEHVVGPTSLSVSNNVHIKFGGTHEATHRLMLGFSPGLPKILEEAGLDEQTRKKVIQLAQRRLFPPILHPHMPLAEIADVAKFLVRNEKKFQHYSPEPDVVGGEVQLATLNRLDGFRWIEEVGDRKRKK